MTDLIQAIAELRRDGPEDATWTASLVADGNPYQSSLAGAVATTLNAALSGDLIQKADADLAVALMVEKAVSAVVQALWPVLGGNHTEAEEWHKIAEAVQAAIRDLVPASALAELQALRDERDAIATARDMMGSLWVKEKDRAEAAEADITTYQQIVADMTQEAELAALRAQVERLVGAAEALGAMPEGYCFCSRNRIGDDSKTHEPECADLRAALTEGAAP